MKKISCAIFKILLIIFVCLMICNNSYICYAGSTYPGQDDGTAASGGGNPSGGENAKEGSEMSQEDWVGNIFKQGDSFIISGKREGLAMDIDDFRDGFFKIFNVIYIIGVALTVVIGAVLGIKFMFGSVEEQAKIKEALVPYIIGCGVVFGTFGIWRIVLSLFNQI